MHYQEKVDEIFKGIHRHRTLRTLFDCLSSEWESTTFEQKEKLLTKLVEVDETLSYFIEGYTYFYTKELANKAYVVEALPKSIRLLYLNVKDEKLKTQLLKIYCNFEEKKEH